MSVKDNYERWLNHPNLDAKLKEELLSMDDKQINDAFYTNVEFGTAGNNLTQTVKEKIDSLNLPGISFIESKERYYPNGDFASYIIGYARRNEDGVIEGKEHLDAMKAYRSQYGVN